MQTGSSWVRLAWAWITLSPSPPKNSDQENLKIQAAINPADFSQISTSECAVQNASLSRHRNTCLLLSPGLFANWNEKCFSSHKVLSLAFSSRSTNSFSSLINFFMTVTKGTFHVVSLVLFPKEKRSMWPEWKGKRVKAPFLYPKSFVRESREEGWWTTHGPHTALCYTLPIPRSFWWQNRRLQQRLQALACSSLLW